MPERLVQAVPVAMTTAVVAARLVQSVVAVLRAGLAVAAGTTAVLDRTIAVVVAGAAVRQVV